MFWTILTAMCGAALVVTGVGGVAAAGLVLTVGIVVDHVCAECDAGEESDADLEDVLSRCD